MKLYFFLLFLLTTLVISIASGTPVQAKDQIKSETKTVIVTGIGSRVPVFISERSSSGSKSLGNCMTPCRTKFKNAGPFQITLTPISDDYLTPIRRGSDEAIIEGNKYKFDISLGTPNEEGLRYLKPYYEPFKNNPERLKCMEFTKSELSNRPETCFSFPPLTPAKAKRSGWCELSVRILTDGSTEDIKVKSCSEKVFELPSVEAAKLYWYYPHMVDGEIKTSRLTKKISYNLFNSRGNLMPAKDGK